MFYCGRDHQAADRTAHKSACKAIKKALQILDTKERELRAHPGDSLTPPNLFEEGVGHFWGILETRPYMQARYALVEALQKIHTREAVQTASDHIMDMLRLCRGDNMGVRELAPALLLRLGKDQACYDFCKWYATEGQRGDYDWGNMDLGFLDLEGENTFESIELWTRKYFDLSHTIAVMLVKVRLLLDISELHKVTLVGEQVPAEPISNIREQLVRAVVKENQKIIESPDQTSLLEMLEDQVAGLFLAVKKSNKYFWPALLDPGDNLTTRPQAYTYGSRAQMVLYLQHNYQSWAETPGAIGMIRELSNKS